VQLWYPAVGSINIFAPQPAKIVEFKMKSKRKSEAEAKDLRSSTSTLNRMDV